MSATLQCLSSKVVHDADFVSIRQDRVKTEAGTEHSYTTISFKVCGVAVLPIDGNGCTRLVGQHRYVADRYTWELVRGAGDLAKPLEAAQRELKEEVGMRADRWLHVLNLMASPGLTDEIAPCFLAWQTTEGHTHRDDTENLRVRTLPFAEALDLVLSGVITDAPSCALVLAVHARATRHELPDEVLALLRSDRA